jgi:hypothetical protein
LYHLVFRTKDSLPTIKQDHSDQLYAYIRNQQEHHKKKSFEEEYRNLLLDSGVTFDERYFP